MTRTEKAGHSVQLANARGHGLTSVRFASPKLIMQARAARGHDYMTGADYAEHRMARRMTNVEMAWDRLMSRRGYRMTESGVAVRTVRR